LAGELNIPRHHPHRGAQEFFSPLDSHNERWLELNIFQDRYRPSDRLPRGFEDADGAARPHVRQASEDALHRAHTSRGTATTCRRAAKLLRHAAQRDARGRRRCLYEFGGSPYAATQFFTRYQDRVMFGKDTYEASE
jgi:hypothetical protein